MKIGQLGFKQRVVAVGAGNVAGPARTGAAFIDHAVHRLDHRRVLAHPEVIIGAPHSNLLGLAIDMAGGLREGTAVAFQLGKHTVAPFAFDGVELAREESLIIHDRKSPSQYSSVYPVGARGQGPPPQSAVAKRQGKKQMLDRAKRGQREQQAGADRRSAAGRRGEGVGPQ